MSVRSLARALVVVIVTTGALLAVEGPGAGEAHHARDRAHRSRSTAPPLVTITATGRGLPRVPATLVGGNLRWVRQADGAFDPATGRIRTDVAALTRSIGVRAIRYAGGTVANLFDYRNAVGTPGCQTSGGFAATRYESVPAAESQYTIGRHAGFARRAAAITNLMVPMVNTSTTAAKAYVRAMAKATGRRHLVVELGNEPFLSDQRYWRAPDLTERLDDYILGGTRVPRGETGDNRLYRTSGCDLLHPARADGTPNQRYRPRFTPIAPDPAPVVTVAGTKWTYVSGLGKAGPRSRVFTLKRNRTEIVFGNGVHGALPQGRMSLRYATGPMLGFKQLYRALKSLRSEGIDVDVCSSWASTGFVARMKRLRLDYDCLAPHTYAVIRAKTPKASLAAYRFAGQASTALLAQLRAAIGKRRFLVVSEFGGVNGDQPGEGGLFVRDLLLGIQLIGQIDQGVRVSNLSNFNTYFNRYGATFRPSGAAYLENLVRKLLGQRPVQLLGLPNGLIGVATRDAGKAALLVVNPSWDRGRTVAIDAEGRSGAACVGERLLRAAPGARTRPARPGQLPASVRPTRSVSWAGTEPLRHTFPSHSVTLLTFAPKRSATCPAVNWLS